MNTERRNMIAACALAGGGLATMWLLTLALENIWYRMGAFYLLAIPAALLAIKLEWKAIFKVRAVHIGVGVIGAALLYAIGWFGVLLIRATLPGLADEISGTYGMLDSAPGYWVWPLLMLVIAGEEIVWRLGVTLAFAEKLKWWSVAVGALTFTLVHLPWGPPLLLVAALFFGGCWSAIAYKTRSFWAPFIAHILWDVLVMFVWRYE